MDTQMTRAEQNLMLLQSLIPERDTFYIWSYRPDGTLIASSCPEPMQALLDRSFRMLGGLEQAQAYAAARAAAPRILGSRIGMQWAVTLETERSDSLIFVIGPVFYSLPSERQLREAIRAYTHARDGAQWASALVRALPKLPALSYAVFCRYVMMVHNTLTGQQLGLEALDEQREPSHTPIAPPQRRDRDRVYLAERALLQMVRNGDISYHDALETSIDLSPGVPVEGHDPLRQMKTSIVVFTTLVSRAAIEGGLSPGIAYPLGDSYIQSAEICQDSGELEALSRAMYHDFILRVHRLRANPNYSHAVQKCCDYIELSLERKIRVADLAALVGYSEYYLTEKFHRETGQSVNSYIRYAKIERAKVLLSSSELSVREISERLAFNTPNYFISSFRETTGYTPAQYRKRFQKR